MRYTCTHVWFPLPMVMFPAWNRSKYLGPETGPAGSWSATVDTDTREMIVRIRESAGDAKSPKATFRLGLGPELVYRISATKAGGDSDE